MSAAKILVTRSDIPIKAIEKLKEVGDVDVNTGKGAMPRNTLLQKIKDVDAVYCLLSDKIDQELLNAAGPNLKVVSTMSVGYDHIDVKEVMKRNIKIGYTPDVLNEATAELTVALLLATNRRLMEANQELYNGGWAKVGWAVNYMTGVGLGGSTVGFFGFGRIGQTVARQLKGFNVRRFLYTSRRKKLEADALNAEFVDFDSLLRESDFVMIVCDLNESTRAVFNKEAFSKMKSNAVLINTSRGAIVDQDALVEALNSSRIRAAGLDVMYPEPLPVDHRLMNARNITLLPHIGSAEESTRERMATVCSENIVSCLRGYPMPYELKI